MRKNIIAFIAIVIVSMSLTACGNNNATAYTIEYREDSSNSQNQTQNQTNNDDSSNISEKDPMQDPCQQGNANVGGGEGQGATPGTFEYYWDGEDYFDIVGFAEANGCTKVFWYDADDNKCDASSANVCEVVFFYGDWYIAVYPGQIQARNQNTNETHEMVSDLKTGTVSICSQNNFKIYSDVCQGFNDILEEIKSN